MGEKERNLLNVAYLLGLIEKFTTLHESQQQSLRDTEENLKELVSTYQKARFALFQARLRQSKRGWCTIGNHVASLSGLRFLFNAGKRWRTSHEADYLREYEELHSSCPSCRKKEFELSGSSDGQAMRHSFPAKKEGKTFSYKRLGEWFIIPENTIIQEMPESAITAELSKELQIPGKITCSFHPFKVIAEG